MNRPYLHSLLSGRYKRLIEINAELVTLTKEKNETVASIEKNELEFDKLGPWEPGTPPEQEKQL